MWLEIFRATSNMYFFSKHGQEEIMSVWRIGSQGMSGE